MAVIRQCSRSACARGAVTTLTYVYADSTAVLGPLAQYAEPHSYDLCEEHSQKLTAPRGWQVVRLALPEQPVGPQGDDLNALVEAVRQAGRGSHPTAHEDAAARKAQGRSGVRIDPDAPSNGPRGRKPGGAGPGGKGHLRVIR